jgi:iron complex transport system substrate-binding protein
MKRILPLFLALALLLTGCTAVSTTESTSQAVSQVDSPSSAPESASSQLESAGEVSITDSNGSQITLDTSAPRVVAAYGSFAEAWLLAGGELVGVTQDALEQRDLGLPEDIAVVGTVKEPNAEEIIALEPDLVLLASDITAQADIRDVLENAGLACAFFQVDTFADYAFMMEQLCAITGREDLYEENVTQVGQQIEEAQANAALASTRPNVLLIRAFSTGIKAKTDDELAGAILKDLGAHNIADDHPSMLEDLSLEEVIAADPDYIFVTTMGDEQKALDYLNGLIQQNPAWSELSAVKEDRYVVLPKDLFHYKPNNRWGESYQYLGEILYPQLFHEE